MQIVENRALLLQTRDPAAITTTIEKSKLLKSGAVVVHWGLQEAMKLARMGFSDTPSPMLRDYQFTGRLTPYEHQKETSAFLTLHRRALCFNEQGTGKTASVIWAADYLMKLGLVKRVLVICPLSIMDSAWRADLFKFAMHRSVVIAHGTPKARVKALATGAEFVIINPDGLGTVEKEIAAAGFDLIVADEANSYKNPRTNRWKILARILQPKMRLWMLTGTPAAQSPLDAYGLAKLVNPKGTPAFYTAFRDSVMYRVSQFVWAARPDSDQTVHRVLQPAIRYEKKDCLDLPPVTFMDRVAPMTASQAHYYRTLKDDMVFKAAGETVTAVNAATAINKLLQIACGCAYSETGEVVEFDTTDRLKALREIIEEASHKVLVFVPFNHTIDMVERSLTKAGISCAVINGAVPVKKRDVIVRDFQESKNPHVLILQPQAAAHGLTLTAADTIVWYAPITSVETYLQANARIDRPGQNNPMTVIHIRGSDVETKLYHLLRSKVTNHEKIIELYNDMLVKV